MDELGVFTFVNSSNVLTSNQFYKKKEYREENSSNEKTKTKS